MRPRRNMRIESKRDKKDSRTPRQSGKRHKRRNNLRPSAARAGIDDCGEPDVSRDHDRDYCVAQHLPLAFWAASQMCHETTATVCCIARQHRSGVPGCHH